MRFPAGDALLHADLRGRGGTALVLLHGLGGSARSWDGACEGLAASRLVAALDLRGCGHSSRGSDEYTLARMGSDVVALLDAIDAERCHLVGHSLGGVVAQEVLTAHPERVVSAVLVSTSARVGETASAAWRKLAQRVRARGLSNSPASSERAFSESYADAHPEAVAAHARIAAESDRDVYAAQAEVASRYDYTTLLAAVTQPALVLQGTADRMTPVGGAVLLARALPQAKLELIEGAGHNLHVEMGRAFVSRVDLFVRGTGA